MSIKNRISEEALDFIIAEIGDKIASRLSTEQRLTGLSPEELISALTPELISAITPELSVRLRPSKSVRLRPSKSMRLRPNNAGNFSNCWHSKPGTAQFRLTITRVLEA